jgi:hypothetical protein
VIAAEVLILSHREHRAHRGNMVERTQGVSVATKTEKSWDVLAEPVGFSPAGSLMPGRINVAGQTKDHNI